ncbi:hypothetical protein [Oscillatoria sp. FACHB-1407]|nr:hypothetical protein [Oscillatoria sp. FACHB-1407]
MNARLSDRSPPTQAAVLTQAESVCHLLSTYKAGFVLVAFD